MLMQTQLVHYVPVATTAMAAVFCYVLLQRYRFKGKGAHLLWWAVGVFCYGLGTGLESTITLSGNSIAMTKAWYIAGALLGGYPLAQGTVYLLLSRRTANILTAISVPVVVVLSVLVAMSPVIESALQADKPSGAILGFKWLRWYCTPVVNSYAAGFLVGGAILSGWRFAKKRATKNRAVGNALIAFGALLPAIGGGIAKAGIVEALYVAEFVGLLFIWAGYASCVRPSSTARAAAPDAAAVVS